MFSGLEAWLDRAPFPRIAGPDAEARKVAVVRVVAGLMLVWRCGLMLRDSWYYFDPVVVGDRGWPFHVLAAGAQLALALGVPSPSAHSPSRG